MKSLKLWFFLSKRFSSTFYVTNLVPLLAIDSFSSAALVCQNVVTSLVDRVCGIKSFDPPYYIRLRFLRRASTELFRTVGIY